jgi:thiamine-monophosphate kinase
LAGGDDYELCFTAKATRHAEILGLQQALSLPLACIGRIEAAKESGRGTVRDESGAPLAGRFPGFDHFSAG